MLQTSSQIRIESRPIWFEVNSFSVVRKSLGPYDVCSLRCNTSTLWQTVDDLDARLCHSWVTNVLPFDNSSDFQITICESQNWSNLLEWCWWIHHPQNTTIVVGHHNDMGETWAVVKTAHQIAVAHKGRSWAECEKALENHREMVSVFDPRWKEDT